MKFLNTMTALFLSNTVFSANYWPMDVGYCWHYSLSTYAIEVRFIQDTVISGMHLYLRQMLSYPVGGSNVLEPDTGYTWYILMNDTVACNGGSSKEPPNPNSEYHSLVTSQFVVAKTSYSGSEGDFGLFEIEYIGTFETGGAKYDSVYRVYGKQQDAYYAPDVGCIKMGAFPLISYSLEQTNKTAYNQRTAVHYKKDPKYIIWLNFKQSIADDRIRLYVRLNGQTAAYPDNGLFNKAAGVYFLLKNKDNGYQASP